MDITSDLVLGAPLTVTLKSKGKYDIRIELSKDTKEINKRYKDSREFLSEISHIQVTEAVQYYKSDLKRIVTRKLTLKKRKELERLYDEALIKKKIRSLRDSVFFN